MPLVTAIETRAQLFLSSWAGEEAHCESAKIESRPACDDGEMFAIRDLTQSCTGLASVFAGSEVFVRVGDVDEVMWKAELLFGAGLG